MSVATAAAATFPCYPNGDLPSPAGMVRLRIFRRREPCPKVSRMHSLPRSSTRSNRRTADEDRAWAQLYASVGPSRHRRRSGQDSLMPTPKLGAATWRCTCARRRPCGNAGCRRAQPAHRCLHAIGRDHPGRRPFPPAAFAAVDRQRCRVDDAPVRRDPAKGPRQHLTRDPEFAKAAERFTATADGATPIAGRRGITRRKGSVSVPSRASAGSAPRERRPGSRPAPADGSSRSSSDFTPTGSMPVIRVNRSTSRPVIRRSWFPRRIMAKLCVALCVSAWVNSTAESFSHGGLDARNRIATLETRPALRRVEPLHTAGPARNRPLQLSATASPA